MVSTSLQTVHKIVMNDICLQSTLSSNVILIILIFFLVTSTYQILSGLMTIVAPLMHLILSLVCLVSLNPLLIFGFFQKNYILNSHGSLLDLIFCSSNLISLKASPDPLVPPDLYHPSLLLKCPGKNN